jgi:tRNA threonylcarbamoyladenosine biosynthesis protein TsaE
MLKKEFILNDLSDLKSSVSQILPLIDKEKTYLINGQMGAGKTTFIQELLTQMEVQELNGSPTYSIINSYHTPKFGEIYHADLYRLNKIEEIYDIGFEEILQNDTYLFVEWPELIKSLIGNKFCEINIKVIEENKRKIVLSFNE